MWRFNYIDELCHHGILGMKWGVRRYQNKDGSLTPAGRRKAAKMKEEYTQLTGKKLIRKPTSKTSKSSSQNGEDANKKKSIKDMTDAELKEKINRLENEKRLATLQGETGTKGEKFVSAVGKQVIAPAAVTAGKQLMTDIFLKVGKDKLGLNPETTKDALADLRKEVDTLELNKRKAVAEDYFTKRNEKKASNSKKKDEPEKAKAEFVDKNKSDKSKDTSSKNKETVIIDAEWREEPVSSTALVPYKQRGESFIDDLFKK